jgi:serine/threonine-protein kinase HipA
MSDGLNVYLRGDKVGRLSLDAGRRFVFAYESDWLASATAVPLSLRLPLRAEPYTDEYARPFFANLLPESELRRVIARKLGLSEQNDFALLEAVGGECAGAVSLLPDDTQPTGEGSYRVLSDDELNDLIDELPKRPMLAGEAGIRLSLAGAQNKLPVFFDGQQVSVPLGDAASSHILKPPIVQYSYTVENEYFCMCLAEGIGLSVPSVSLLHKRQSLYVIERYDRKHTTQGGIERVHQEDFCQALGIAPDQKYEKEGGPSLQQCFALLRERSVLPVADVSALLDWVIFNYLIGNADAHGKNISLLLTQQGPHLAPFYDLMSTAVYSELAEKLAMKIGGDDRPDWIIERRWQSFAEEIGIAYKLVLQRLVYMKEAVLDVATQLIQDTNLKQNQCSIYDDIHKIIQQRRTKITNSLTAAKDEASES